LNETKPGTRNIRFGTHVWRNCDTRFSCASYRQYAWTGRQVVERSVMQYFVELASDLEQDAWRSANLDAALDGSDWRTDFGTRL
jgi:hypothetical protein